MRLKHRHTRHIRRHPRYHHTHTRKRHTTYRSSRRIRGGNETIGTWNGIPYTKNALVTNSKGITKTIRNISYPLSNSETNELLGDIDV